MEMVEIKMPANLAAIYARTDRELFPASQMAQGLEREDTLNWADFTVAEPFGMTAVKDTFANADYKNRGYKYVTELAVVMNKKCWEWYTQAENAIGKVAEKAREFSRYYSDRYYEICDWAAQNLKGDEATFFYSVLD